MVALILKFLHQLIQEGRFTVFSVAFIFLTSSPLRERFYGALDKASIFTNMLKLLGYFQ
jgi:hypothetical protein